MTAEGAKDNLRLGPCQLCTKTVVDATAEGQMLVVGPVEGESVGVGKPRRVAVGSIKGFPIGMEKIWNMCDISAHSYWKAYCSQSVL